MRLDVDVIAPEQVQCALSSQLFHHIRVNAAAIVSSAWVPFRVLVCQDAPLGLHDRERSEILGSDQLKAMFLSALFIGNDSKYFRVGLLKRGHRFPS